MFSVKGDGALTVAGTAAVTGAVTLSSTLAVGGNATITGTVTLSSTLAVSGNAAITGTSTLSDAVTLGSTLSVGGTAEATATVDFIASSGMLQLDDPFGFDGLIGGFAPGILIDLPDVMVAESGTILAGNTLQIVIAGGGTIDLRR